MADILPTPYLSPTADPVQPTRGICWVLSLALAMVVVAAWLMIMFQLAMVVRAELRLQNILTQASEFAALPQVRASEIEAFVDKRLAAANYGQWKTTVGPDSRGLQCLQVSIAASDALPTWIQPLSVGLRGQEIAVRLHAEPQTWFFVRP